MTRHLVTLVTPMEAGAEGLRESILELATFFYADGGLITSPHPEILQRAFNILTDLFGRVGIRTNLRKMMIMD